VDSEEITTPLTPYKDEVVPVVTAALTNTSTLQPALACLLGLVTCQGLLSDEEIGFIVHNVTEVLLATSEDNDGGR
jgi:DNA repair/transcription protein MET18/MMS19